MEVYEFNVNAPELSDLDVDNLIEEVKEKEKEIKRLKKLSEKKIQEVEYNTKCKIEPLEARITYIHDQLGMVIKNAKDKKETKTQYKKSFISGDVVLKKSQNKIKNPKLKGQEAYEIEKLKEYCEPFTDYKFNWAELKKELDIVDGVVVNKETGEYMGDIIEWEQTPEQLVIK